MALLRGFQKSETKGDSAKVLNLLEKSYLNRTEGGEFNTVEDVQGLIDTYRKLPQSVDVQTRIADLENKKLQLGVKKNDILSQKDIFDSDLQQGLDAAAKNNFKNMRSLIGSYATIYGDAEQRYRTEVLSKIAKQYGTAGTIPADTIKYMKTLDEKARFYSQLFNAYNIRDPKTGEFGQLNPEALAVQIDTNPTNGSVQRIEIVPSGNVDGKSYMRSEVGMNVMDDQPSKKLPVYLRVNDVGVADDGTAIRGSALGNVVYQEKMVDKKSAGVLAPVKQSVGFGNWINFLSDSPEEKLNSSIDSIVQNGIKLSSGSYKYDSQDVPNDNVLKLGGRLFYSTEKDGQILEIAGDTAKEKNDNLRRYLTGVGKNPDKYSVPYFVTKDYLVDDKGDSRVGGKIDANYFAPQQAPVQPTSFDTTQSSPVSYDTQPAQGFFSKPILSDAVNRQNKPDEAQVESAKKTSISDVIEKGKSFFRNRVA